MTYRNSLCRDLSLSYPWLIGSNRSGVRIYIVVLLFEKLCTETEDGDRLCKIRVVTKTVIACARAVTRLSSYISCYNFGIHAYEERDSHARTKMVRVVRGRLGTRASVLPLVPTMDDGPDTINPSVKKSVTVSDVLKT